MTLANVLYGTKSKLQIVRTGLVLDLPLHQLDGDSFMSKDHYGHLATVTGATWGSQGRTFTVDDSINVGDHTQHDFGNGNFTLEAWVKLNALDGADRRIISKQTGAPVNAYCLRITGNVWDFFVYWAGTSGTAGGGTPVVNTWYHVLAKRAGNTIYLYVDDVLIQSAAYPTLGTVATAGVNLHIGSHDGSSEYSESVIGEVREYNRDLTTVEGQHNRLATKWRYR